MKILFLNPKINAKHEICRSLLRKGVAFLFPENSDDALQMLEFHGDTIDLAIIHREDLTGKEAPGVEFVEKLKLNSPYKELPVILTTEAWNDANCAEHQNGISGANAYLHSPFSEKELVAICEAVLGQPLLTQASPSPGKSVETGGAAVAYPVLEEVSDVFKKSDAEHSASDISIQLMSFGIGDVPTASSEELSEVVPQEVQAEAQDFVLTGSEVPESVSEPLQGQEIDSGQGGGLEISEAPEMTSDSLEVSGPSKISQDPMPNEGLEPTGPIDLGQTPDQLEQGAGAVALEEAPQGFEVLESPNNPAEDMHSKLDFESPKYAAAQIGEAESAVDSQVAEEMPYLVPGYKKGNRAAFDPSLVFAEALGDAVVPGGAAQAPDLETFKKYLMLREQDVAVLSNQLKAAHDQLAASEQLLKEERTKRVELTYLAAEQKKKIDDFEKEKNATVDRLRIEVEDLVFQLKAKTDKSRILEQKVRETIDEMEHLKTRVRSDIRKIRVREKELENRLEMGKKDSEALIAARENKIIELKRKLDVLEFNMDLLQDQYSKEKENTAKLRERLIKAAQMVRVAGGLLDSNKEGREAAIDVSGDETSENKNLEDEGLEAS